MQGRSTAFLGLGSNIGDRAANLKSAIDALGEIGLETIESSSVFETEPFGVEGQEAYFNMVVKVGFDPCDALELLDKLESVENSLGRTGKGLGLPRSIDVDLLLAGDMTIESERVTIPHPRMYLRRFVLEPLAEIAAVVRHPRLGKTVGELLASSSDESSVRKIGAIGELLKQD
ncbi:MAG: 2-amino-4-hydroxy-6-hydroxymethyldihydropteridine diphosphokinase [Acidobacteriota bacterium]